MSYIKAIIFDADGMIVHGERFSHRLEKDYGISTVQTSEFFKNEFQKCIVGEADLKQALEPYLEKWKWKGGIHALLDFWFDPKHSQFEERFLPVIRALQKRGKKVYLATNNEFYRTENLVKRGLGEWFDDIFASAHIGAKKPETSFYQYIADQSSLSISEILFWDDDEENINGASLFGFATRLYTDYDAFSEYMSTQELL